MKTDVITPGGYHLSWYPLVEAPSDWPEWAWMVWGWLDVSVSEFAIVGLLYGWKEDRVFWSAAV